MDTTTNWFPRITLATSKTLDSLRVMACLVVVLSHLYEFITGNLNNSVNEWISYLAVAVFFFISGWVNTHSLLWGDSAKQFYLKRVKRIYPTYLKALALGLGLSLIFGAYNHSYLLNALFLNPFVGTVPTNAPLWSLSYEVYLYALLPLMLINSTFWSIVGWLLACLVFAVVGKFLLFYAFSAGIVCFVCGLQLPRVDFFARYGRYTYEIYVYHYLILFALWGMF